MSKQPDYLAWPKADLSWNTGLFVEFPHPTDPTCVLLVTSSKDQAHLRKAVGDTKLAAMKLKMSKDRPKAASRPAWQQDPLTKRHGDNPRENPDDRSFESVDEPQ